MVKGLKMDIYIPPNLFLSSVEHRRYILKNVTHTVESLLNCVIL